MKISPGIPYQGKSYIANSQKCVNLYAEGNAKDAPFPLTYYPTPGSLLFTTAVVPAATNGAIRGCFRTSIGTAYIVVGSTVYFMTNAGALVFVGSILDRLSQVYMADNGLAVVLVDGSATGYAIDINTNAFGIIIDPSFLGADFVVFLDTFFVFNRPGTNEFYISLSIVNFALLTAGTSFDPLDIASKSGSADPIVAILIVHQYLWLIGSLTTEIWVGSGSADFFFQQVQGAYIDNGCTAPYSASNQDVVTFWLMQNRQGSRIVVQGKGYSVDEISTPYMVNRFKSYATVSDAIGFCFQLDDHAYYALIFPTANEGWLYDLTTGYWNAWGYTDNNGVLNRPRANCCMFAFDKVFVGDFENGQVLELNSSAFTDAGQPISRIITFPHIIDNGDRIRFNQFALSMEPGTDDNPADVNDEFIVSLRWSDDGGKTFGQAVEQSLGSGGELLTQAQWNRLGQGRDRVFELAWSAPYKTALNGGFVDFEKVGS